MYLDHGGDTQVRRAAKAMGLGGAPPEAKVSPSSEAKEGGKEGRNEERKGMEEGKGVMGALFRADHGRPGKALPRSHA